MKKTLRQRIRKVNKIIESYTFKVVKTFPKVGEIWQVAVACNPDSCLPEAKTLWGMRSVVWEKRDQIFFVDTFKVPAWAQDEILHPRTHGYIVVNLRTGTKQHVLLDELYLKEKLLKRLTKS